MVTIVMAISRPDFLKQVFACLETLECDASQVNLFTYVDGDMQLFETARNLTVNSKFKQRLSVYRAKGQANVSSIRRRRQRIADIHNEMKKFIYNADYVFVIEDDTIFNPLTLQRLLKTYSDNPYAGFVSGAQIGRWGYTYIGAWKVDDVYDITKIESVPKGEGVIEVDAAGLYCCLTKKDLYMNHTFKPFGEVLGPDVDYGIELRKVGYKNYVNFDCTCSHLTKQGEIKFLNTPIQVVTMRRDDTKLGWAQEVV